MKRVTKILVVGGSFFFLVSSAIVVLRLIKCIALGVDFDLSLSLIRGIKGGLVAGLL
jgi:hypothetical protein